MPDWVPDGSRRNARTKTRACARMFSTGRSSLRRRAVRYHSNSVKLVVSLSGMLTALWWEIYDGETKGGSVGRCPCRVARGKGQAPISIPRSHESRFNSGLVKGKSVSGLFLKIPQEFILVPLLKFFRSFFRPLMAKRQQGKRREAELEITKGFSMKCRCDAFADGADNRSKGMSDGRMKWRRPNWKLLCNFR